MTQEELKAYLDSRKNDVIDATIDAALDIAVYLVSQDMGINFSNSNAQQCIALATKGSSEAMSELVRSSGMTMETAKTFGFFNKILKNLSDFCSLGNNIKNLKSSINDYYNGNNSASGKVLSDVFSALSTITGLFGGPLGTIVSTQLGIASDLANEAASLSKQYQERYDMINSIDEGKREATSEDIEAFKKEYESMKEEASKSKEGYMLFQSFVNTYSSLLIAFGCDLSELNRKMAEINALYNGSGENSINYYDKEIISIYNKVSLSISLKSDLDKDEMGDAETAVKYDPLIIDLDKDGIFTKAKEDGVYFDFEGDGFKEKTAWVDNGDGLLVLDRNGNGVIDDGSELFGDKTILENGNVATDGFMALAELDSNGDGVIDSADDRFGELKVWIDKNSDGISQSDELYSLDELGIKSISLKKSVSNVKEEGSVVANKAVVSFENGDSTKIGEIKFDIDSMDTINELVGSIRAEIKDGMPQIIASGNVLSLQEAMEIDDELYGMVKEFTASKDLGLLKGMVEEIVFKWTGIPDVEAGSRGKYVDARELAVIEKFYGKAFVGKDGANPNNTAGAILSDVYDKLFNSIYYGLLSQTVLKKYCDLISVKEFIVSGERKIDYSEVMNVFESELSQDYKNTIIKMNMFFGLLASNASTCDIFNKEDIYSICEDSQYLKEIKSACEGTVIFNLSNAGTLNGSKGLDIIIGTEKNETINGNAGDDILFGGLGNDTINGGDGNDYIYGEDGDDTLNGGAGNDILVGGKGNDYLNGGAGNDILVGGRGNDYLNGGSGNDTYVIGLGDGNDTIYDNSGSNIIRFTDGIKPEDLIATYGDSNSIILTNRNTGDSVEIQKFRYSESYRNFIMVFDDGTEMKLDDERSPLRNLEGTDGNDTLSAFFTGIKYHAGAGNDTLNGSSGADEMYGEDGDDRLIGSSGNDILVGGKGNDYLNGGEGNDTYVIGLGDGNDTIYDNSGSNIIRFTDGIKPEDLIATYGDSNSIILTNRNTGDSVEIQKFRYSESYRNFIMVFDDGTEMKLDDERSPLRNLEGTDGNDTLSAFFTGIKYHAGAGNDTLNGSSGADEMYGEDGDDRLIGSSGNDILVGGKGNDYLNGGEGNDTYVIGLGDGNDTIYDNSGSNIIRFTDGIKPEDLIATYGDSNSIILTNRNTGDSIEIQKFRYSESYRNFIMVFDDGTEMKLDDERSPLRNLEGTDGNDTLSAFFTGIKYHAGAGNDTLNGSSGADEMYGEDGDDNIYGNSGDDILIGGKGNDYLNGGSGNDTYVIGLGDGNDTIYDNSGSNIIRFTDGIKPEDLIATYGDSNSIILTNRNTGDSVEIQKFRYSESYRNFIMVFDDGTEMKLDDERSPLRNLEGTDGNDTLSAFFTGIKYHAGAGNDTLNGSSGADEMYGEDGDDRLIGSSGDDILVGGKGNDYLNGGSGNDTYVIGLGDGNDTIYDNSGSNIIRFTDGIKPEDLIATYGDSNSIILTNRNTGDSIEIQKFRYSESYRNFTLQFDDGRTATVDYINKKLIYEEINEISEISSANLQAIDEISSVNAMTLREIVASDSIMTEDFTTVNEATANESNITAIGTGLSDMDTFTDLQANLLAQELSALGGGDSIYATDNNINNVQSELFTEQFVVE